MKRTVVAIVSLLCACSVLAQTTPLQVQLDGKNQPYLVHLLAAKENFYSVGRIYNISPRVFAPYNGLELSSPLSIGQSIRIPLTEQNFWQSGSRKENEVVVPLYYTPAAGEGLTAVSRLFKTDNASIRSWNNLNGDAIGAGKKLIIGFLKVDKELSPLAAQGLSRREPALVQTEQRKEESKPVVKEVAKPTVKEEVPAFNPVSAQAVAKKEEKKPVVEEAPKVTVTPASYDGSGFFKDEFNRQTNNGRNTAGSSGTGATFKSTSGWSDGKFYILVDNIEKGSIVMVRNPVNGKAVFAKVLAGVQETKPGSGYLFLLSNAAASQLGIASEKFTAELVWGK